MRDGYRPGEKRMSVWISTVRIGNPAYHLCSGHVDHNVWETTGRIRDQGSEVGEKEKS